MYTHFMSIYPRSSGCKGSSLNPKRLKPKHTSGYLEVSEMSGDGYYDCEGGRGTNPNP